LITPLDAVQDAEPDSKPGLASFCPGLEQPPPAGLMVNVNEVLPEPPADAVAVAVTLYVPAVVGVPDTVPVEEPIVMPGGSPVADQVYGGVPPLALSVKEAIAVPTVPDLLPGLVTVTPPPPPPTIECEIWQPLLSLPQVPCIANVPVVKETFCERPAPLVSHAHLSAFSWPVESVQPPAGF